MGVRNLQRSRALFLLLGGSGNDRFGSDGYSGRGGKSLCIMEKWVVSAVLVKITRRRTIGKQLCDVVRLCYRHICPRINKFCPKNTEINS